MGRAPTLARDSCGTRRSLFGFNGVEDLDCILDDSQCPGSQHRFFWPDRNDGGLAGAGAKVPGHESLALAGNRDLIGPRHQEAVAEPPPDHRPDKIDLRDYCTHVWLEPTLSEHQLRIFRAGGRVEHDEWLGRQISEIHIIFFSK